jgi:hypothetical protein
MTTRPPLQLPAPLSVRVLAVVMSCVISGSGLLAFVTNYVGARSTRYGDTGPLAGAAARHFGVSIFLFGLLPLVLLARSPRSAVWFATAVVALALLSVFFGGFLFP